MGSSRPSGREQILAAEVDELTTALGEAHVELRVWKKSAEHHGVRLAPTRTSRPGDQAGLDDSGERAMADAERNKQTVARLFDAFRAGDVDAFDDLIVENYVQHSPPLANGLQAVKDRFAPVGPVDVDVHRVVAEGDLVAVHAHYKTWKSAAVDIFRLNDEGKIIEHWSALQEVPETTVSGNDMFSQLT